MFIYTSIPYYLNYNIYPSMFIPLFLVYSNVCLFLVYSHVCFLVYSKIMFVWFLMTLKFGSQPGLTYKERSQPVGSSA